MRPIPRLILTALLSLPLLAGDCGDSSVAPVQTGSIQGRVTAEGAGIAGVNVTLGAGFVRVTDATGGYRFETLPAGSYFVSIANFPPSVAFSETVKPAVVGDPTLAVTVDFEGSVVRTASIVGNVRLAGGPLTGVTVMATGPDGTRTAMTEQGGEFGITGLAAGTYTVSVNPPPGVVCEPGAEAVTLETGQVRSILFDCS